MAPSGMKHMTRFTKSLGVILGIYASVVAVPGAGENSGDHLAKEISLPAVTIAIEAGRVSIRFSGTLQSADELAGPWNDESSAFSPFEPIPAKTRRFYRTRQPDSIFASRSVVALPVTGPFQTHFDLAFAGLPDGIFPPVRQKPYFDGGSASGRV